MNSSTDTCNQYDVVVIGAGISGLTAAYELQKQGKRVLVLEETQRVGGRIFTDHVDDFTYEVGAQFIGGFFYETLKLVKDLGLSKDLTRFHNAMYMQIKGVFKIVDQESFWHLMFPPGLTFRDRMKMSNLLVDIIKDWSNLNYQEIEKSIGIDNLTIEEYAFQRLNPHILRSLIAPVISSIYFMSSAEVSSPLYMTMIKNFMNFKLYTLKGGMSKLPETLAKRLDVQLGQRVTHIMKRQSGWTVATRNQDQYQDLWNANNVIVAIPSHQALELFPNAFDLTIHQSYFLQKQKYSKTCALVTGYNYRMRPGAYSFIVPPTEKAGIAAISLEHEKYCEHVPQSYGLHTIYTHCHFTEKMMNLTDNEKESLMLKDTEKIFAKYRQHVTWTKLYNVPIGLPHPYVNKAREVADFQKEQKENVQSGLLFVGDYLNWPSIEGSIAVAKRVASMFKNR